MWNAVDAMYGERKKMFGELGVGPLINEHNYHKINKRCREQKSHFQDATFPSLKEARKPQKVYNPREGLNRVSREGT